MKSSSSYTQHCTLNPLLTCLFIDPLKFDRYTVCIVEATLVPSPGSSIISSWILPRPLMPKYPHARRSQGSLSRVTFRSSVHAWVEVFSPGFFVEYELILPVGPRTLAADDSDQHASLICSPSQTFTLQKLNWPSHLIRKPGTVKPTGGVCNL
ncbi:uncharacterized protein BDR25DRAFT_49018 [Lindgomyces ingoldianus]|uniref:Uncharacterized protein n=1 Tax=Lindgomyces ingoldianus TaxID=673940 RepID=A0ACB6QTA7_9PLEO|nr:uncharacterized protein BDR25DRAFT_49018 [Lindgomyces ingoldianus]KAF2469401.1 hypothetical protein BDR25DRAFT_49018 [Lindgomyces ingoldianus]